MTVQLGFTCGPDSGTISGPNFIPTSMSPGADQRITQSFTVEPATICVAEGSCVQLSNGIQLPIEALYPGSFAIGSTGLPVRISGIVRLDKPIHHIYSVALPGAKPLLISKGHPLLLEGKEILPEDLVENGISKEIQLPDPIHLYTLITDRREFVLIQGMNVGTWCESSWENFINNDNKAAHLQWSYI